MELEPFFCSVLFVLISFSKLKFYADGKSCKKNISWYSQIYSKDKPPHIFVHDEENEEENMSTTMDSKIFRNAEAVLNSNGNENDNFLKRKTIFTNNMGEKIHIKKNALEGNVSLIKKVNHYDDIDEDCSSINSKINNEAIRMNRQDEGDYEELATVDNSSDRTNTDNIQDVSSYFYRTMSEPIKNFRPTDFITTTVPSAITQHQKNESFTLNIKLKNVNEKNREKSNRTSNGTNISSKKNYLLNFKKELFNKSILSNILYNQNNDDGVTPIEINYANSAATYMDIVIDDPLYIDIIERLLPFINPSVNNNFFMKKKYFLKKIKRSDKNIFYLNPSDIIQIIENIMKDNSWYTQPGDQYKKKFSFLNDIDKKLSFTEESVNGVIINTEKNIIKEDTKESPNRIVNNDLQRLLSYLILIKSKLRNDLRNRTEVEKVILGDKVIQINRPETYENIESIKNSRILNDGKEGFGLVDSNSPLPISVYVNSVPYGMKFCNIVKNRKLNSSNRKFSTGVKLQNSKTAGKNKKTENILDNYYQTQKNSSLQSINLAPTFGKTENISQSKVIAKKFSNRNNYFEQNNISKEYSNDVVKHNDNGNTFLDMLNNYLGHEAKTTNPNNTHSEFINNDTDIDENFLQLMMKHANVSLQSKTQNTSNYEKWQFLHMQQNISHPTRNNFQANNYGITRIKMFGFIYEAENNVTKYPETNKSTTLLFQNSFQGFHKSELIPKHSTKISVNKDLGTSNFEQHSSPHSSSNLNDSSLSLLLKLFKNLSTTPSLGHSKCCVTDDQSKQNSVSTLNGLYFEQHSIKNGSNSTKSKHNNVKNFSTLPAFAQSQEIIIDFPRASDINYLKNLLLMLRINNEKIQQKQRLLKSSTENYRNRLL